MTEHPEHDEALERRVREALSHDPGEAYFTSFADRVQARIEAEAQAKRAASRPASPWARWFGSPRALAWVGSAAALLLVSGVTFVMLRDRPGAPGDVLARRELATTAAPSPDAAGGAPAPLVAPAPAEPARDHLAREEERSRTMAQSEPAARDAGEDLSFRSASPAPMATAPAPSGRAANRVSPPPVTGSRELNTAGRASSTIVPQVDEVKVGVARQDAAADSRPIERDAQQKAEGTLGKESSPAARSNAFAPAPEALESEQALELRDRARRAKQSRSFAGGASRRRCGTVRDPQGRPLAGATLVIAETGASTTSTADGSFCLEAPAGAYTLRALSVGFRSHDVTLDEGADAGALAVTLDPVETVGNSGALSEKYAFGRGALAPGAVTTSGAWAAEPALARALATRATQRVSRARRESTATSWDAAAGEWSTALAAMRTPTGQLEARALLAEARYEAWRIEPSGERARRWREARDAFAAAAPNDPRLASTPWLKAGAIPQ